MVSSAIHKDLGTRDLSMDNKLKSQMLIGRVPASQLSRGGEQKNMEVSREQSIIVEPRMHTIWKVQVLHLFPSGQCSTLYSR